MMKLLKKVSGIRIIFTCIFLGTFLLIKSPSTNLVQSKQKNSLSTPSKTDDLAWVDNSYWNIEVAEELGRTGSPANADILSTTEDIIISGNSQMGGGLIGRISQSGELNHISFYHSKDTSVVPRGSTFNDIEATVDGGYIVAGYAFPKGLIVKYRSDDSIEWEYSFEAVNAIYIRSIKQTRDNGFIATGSLGSSATGDEFIGALILRIEPDGNIWSKVYSSTIGETISFKDVVEIMDGSFVFSGSRSYWGGHRGILLKLKSNGDFDWVKSLGKKGLVNDHQYASFLVPTENGFVVAASQSYSGAIPWLIKIRADGEVIEESNTYTFDTDPVSVYSLEGTSDGGYVMGGYDSWVNDEGRHQYYGWILKIDNSLSGQWVKFFSDGSLNQLRRINTVLETSNHDLIAVGRGSDIWALKTNNNGEIPGCDWCTEDGVTTSQREIELINASEIIQELDYPSGIQIDEVTGVGEMGSFDNLLITLHCYYYDKIQQSSDLIEVVGQYFPGGKASFEVKVVNNDSISTPLIHPYILGTGPDLIWSADGLKEDAEVLNPGQEHTFKVPLFFSESARSGIWESVSIGLWDFSNDNIYYSNLPSGSFQKTIAFEVSDPPELYAGLPFYIEDTPDKTFLVALQGNEETGGIGEINSYYDHEYPSWRGHDVQGSIRVFTGELRHGCCIYGHNSYSGHNGIDFQAEVSGVPGDPILASQSGVVVDYCNTWITNGTTPCYLDGGYGNYILIKHENNGCFYSHYAHLHKIESTLLDDLINNGENVVAVSKGQSIGEMGNTGNYDPNEGPQPVHGHFGLYWYCGDIADISSDEFEDHAVDPYGWRGDYDDPVSSEIGSGTFPVSVCVWEEGCPERVRMDSNGGSISVSNVTLDIPVGALSFESTVELGIVTTFAIPNVGMLRVGLPFQIQIGAGVVGENSGASILDSDLFSVPATVTVEYNEIRLGSIDENKLAISKWDEDNKGWVEVPTTIDAVLNTLTIQITDGGHFDIQAAGFTNYLPIIVAP